MTAPKITTEQQKDDEAFWTWLKLETVSFKLQSSVIVSNEAFSSDRQLWYPLPLDDFGEKQETDSWSEDKQGQAKKPLKYTNLQEVWGDIRRRVVIFQTLI